MKLTRKTVLSVDLSQKDLAELEKSIRNLNFLSHAEVHLVFVFQTTSMSLGFGEFPYVFPTVEDQRVIQQASEATLVSLKEKCFSSDFTGKVVVKCLFGDDAKYRLCEYVNEHGIDLVVMWAREKRGLFESSFTNYVGRHTDANVLVIKQRAHLR